MRIEPIAHVSSPFEGKFGIPRQSGLTPDLTARIVFEEGYRDEDALRGIEGFDYLWLIWGFSENVDMGWKPLVRPPRMGGNERMGVFATRSPFRPNPLGLSSVRLLGVEQGAQGLELIVSGADLMDSTPIFDIKPYVSYSDVHEDVRCGFIDENRNALLDVEYDEDVLAVFGEDVKGLLQALARDPRPAYHTDPERIYGMSFAGREVHFRVEGTTLTVTSVDPLR